MLCNKYCFAVYSMLTTNIENYGKSVNKIIGNQNILYVAVEIIY